MLLSQFDVVATAPGGVVKLRELILTLAVQGKLVSQDPADEPASELLKKIRAEKDRLIAEGKIKRDKPLAEITDEEKPFALPQGWEWVKGRDLFSVIRGVTYQKTDVREAPAETHLPILRANNIRGTVNLEDLVYVPASLVSEDQFLRAGDYVVCLASGSKNLVGKAAPFTESLVCSFGAFCGAIRPIKEIGYFAVYLASPMYRDSVSEASAGIGINNLKGSSLLDLDIALPPEAEQSRIVTRVEELMRLCDALEAKAQLEASQHTQLRNTLLGTLTASTTPEELTDNWHRVATHFDLLLDRPEAVDALEQTILQLAVRGLLVPQDPQDEPASVLLQKIRAEKDKLIAQGKIKRDKPLPPIAQDQQPFALPMGWEWATLESLASQITDGTHHTPTYIPVGIPFLSVKDLSSGVIDFSNTRFISSDAHEELAKRCNPELGDVLLTKIGTTGIAVVVNTSRRFSLFVSVALIKLPYISVDRDFLSLVINSPFVRQQSEDGTEGVGNKNLVLRKIKAFQIPLPPLAEQSRIVARVASLRALCTSLRQRLTTARTQQTLLAEVMVQTVAA